MSVCYHQQKKFCWEIFFVILNLQMQLLRSFYSLGDNQPMSYWTFEWIIIEVNCTIGVNGIWLNCNYYFVKNQNCFFSIYTSVLDVPECLPIVLLLEVVWKILCHLIKDKFITSPLWTAVSVSAKLKDFVPWLWLYIQWIQRKT